MSECLQALRAYVADLRPYNCPSSPLHYQRLQRTPSSERWLLSACPTVWDDGPAGALGDVHIHFDPATNSFEATAYISAALRLDSASIAAALSSRLFPMALAEEQMVEVLRLADGPTFDRWTSETDSDTPLSMQHFYTGLSRALPPAHPLFDWNRVYRAADSEEWRVRGCSKIVRSGRTERGSDVLATVTLSWIGRGVTARILLRDQPGEDLGDLIAGDLWNMIVSDAGQDGGVAEIMQSTTETAFVPSCTDE